MIIDIICRQPVLFVRTFSTTRTGADNPYALDLSVKWPLRHANSRGNKTDTVTSALFPIFITTQGEIFAETGHFHHLAARALLAGLALSSLVGPCALYILA